jgi:pimeloyl-ACP methyl ester carboxylesterase
LLSSQEVRQVDHRVRTDGGDLHVCVWSPAGSVSGGLAPIILLHDSLGCVELWRDFPRALALATARDVIAYDRLGFGQSSAHPGRLDLDFVKTEAELGLRRVKDALGIGRVVLLGHSVGGAMAAVAASNSEIACVGLITIAAQAFAEHKTLEAIREARRTFAEPGQIERLARYHGAKAPWVIDAWTETWLAPGFADWSIMHDLARVQCRVLALHGDRDEYGSLAHPATIAETAVQPGAFFIVPDCGHVPHREKPEIVLGKIGDFLADLPV